MIYPYTCPNCDHDFEVIKSVKEIDVVEKCKDCDTISNRTIAKCQGIDKTAAGDWNRASYNPAFGEHLTPREAKKKASKLGLTAVGDEPVEKVHKHFEDQRAAKKKSDLAAINMDIGEVRGK